jgi:hypothetical protein
MCDFILRGWYGKFAGLSLITFIKVQGIFLMGPPSPSTTVIGTRREISNKPRGDFAKETFLKYWF